MVKNKVLTPVLAGVLGLSIAGSGIGYYLVNKDGGSKDGTLREQKINQVAENINNTVDKAEKIIKGELDYAYDADVTVSFGDGLAELTGGQSFDDIKVSTSSKQKGDNTEADVTLFYGDNSVVSVNAFYQRGDNDTAYFQIPELSSAYLKADKATAQQYLEQEAGVDLDEIMSSAETIDFDAQAFVDSLDDYAQVVKDNFPEVKEEGKKEGDIDGIEYSYTTESYDITEKDAQNMVKAVLEKVKTDENIKKLYDQAAESAGEEVDAPSFEEAIDEMLEEVNTDIGEEVSDESIELTTYNDGDDIVGFKLVPNIEDADFELDFVTISTDEAEAIDLTIDIGGEASFTMKGSITEEDDALNGEYVMNLDAGEYVSAEATYTVDNVKAVDDAFTGSMRIDAKMNSGDQDISGWVEIISDSNADKTDVKFIVGYNGSEMVTVAVEGKKTEASDVTIPGSDAQVYNALDEEELNKYLEGCDVEGFQEHVKSALGEELYALIESSTSSGFDDDYDYDDYDWDDEDYDWDDEDWEDYDWDDYDWDDEDYDWEDYDFDDLTVETEKADA